MAFFFLKRNAVFIFFLVLALLFVFFSLRSFSKESDFKDVSVTLDGFKSDFLKQEGKKVLYDEIIDDKNRHLAFGVYTNLPYGEYIATFFLGSRSSVPVDLYFQVAADRGKTIITSQKRTLDSFPVQTKLPFIIYEEKEIEPLVLFSSGNQEVDVERVEINRVKGIFPWKTIIFQSFIYSILLAFLILSVIHTFESSERWKNFLGFFLFLIGSYLIITKAWISEDAFITLRHVENFVDGLGPVFNAGEKVEGYTHPLWFFIVSLFRWLGISPKGAMILPGLLASFTALYILFFKINFPSGKTSRPILNPAAAVLIGVSAFIDFGTSGLETSLAYLLLILYAKFIAEDRWKSQPVTAGLVVALLTLTRPDFFVFPAFLLFFYVYEILKKRLQWKHLVRFSICPVLLIGGYQIFRMGYFAAFFPNPFYTKSGSSSYFSQGMKYLLDFSQGSLLLVILFLALLAVLLNVGQRRLRSQIMILCSGLIYGFFIVRGGGDFMHGRFLLPAVLLITVSVAGAFDRFLEKKVILKMISISLCLGLFFLSTCTVPVQKKGRFYNYGISDDRYAYYKDKNIPLKFLLKDTIIIMWKHIGRNYQNLSAKAKFNVRIAYKNVGFTGFYAGRHVYVLDTLGLTDPVVSRIALTKRERPGHEKRAPFGYLMMRELTFHETPFPLWNKVAATKYGVLWDISPKTRGKLHFILDVGFKEEIDRSIVSFLKEMDTTKLETQAEFLFFLKRYWYPYATEKGRELFIQVYNEDAVAKKSSSCQWIQKNEDKVDIIFSRIQDPLSVKKFFENIVFALGKGFSIKF